MKHAASRYFPRTLSLFGLLGVLTLASTTQAAAEHADSSDAALSDDANEADTAVVSSVSASLGCPWRPSCWRWPRR